MFKGTRDGISIILDPVTDFREIIAVLAERIGESASFFEGAASGITLVGRELSASEEAEISDTFKQAGLNVSFRSPEPKVPKQDHKRLPHELDYHIKGLERGHFDGAEHPTKFVRSTLRSGTVVRFRGSVVVFGDVNPGAEILAEGNVIVIGSIKGLVQAGSMGDESCFIFGLKLAPLQLRIAGRIYAPETADGFLDMGTAPMKAYIEDSRMYIRPL